MAVVIETTLGDITVDLYIEERPQTCKNFLKLCKIKYYNFCLFHSIQANFIAQTGDPSGVGTGGESVFGIVYGSESRYYEGEKMPKIKHNKPGLLSMVNCGNNMLGSQFFVTLGTDLQSLEEHCVFAEVTEGHDILVKLNDAICDHQHRPYQDIRITHTVILDDPFEDLPGLVVPLQSPDISKIQASNGRIGADEKINDEEGLSEAQLQEIKADREAKARATILEIVGDLPDADIAPPENVLFVCKLNPVTTDEDLEIIFSRFGKVKSCEVIRDHMTGESLQYAFVEFEDQRACEQAYLKMDNVLIDDRRIHVDFSQSVSKVKWRGKGRGVQYFDKADEKDNSWSNFDRHSGSKRDHYRERDRDRDRDRRGREDERRRRGGGERDDEHRQSRRNDRRREDRWPEDDRWEDDRKRRGDERRMMRGDDDRMYGGRRRDDRRRGGMDDERRRGDDKKRNGTDRRGVDKDFGRRTDVFDVKEDRIRESKHVSSSYENKEGSSKRENMKTSTRERHVSSRKEEEKLVSSNAEPKNKEEVKDVSIVNNVNTTQQVHERVEVLDDSWSNDNNYKESSKEETSKLSTANEPRKKKKRRRVSTSSNSSSSESSETSSSSSSLDKKKRSKSSLTVAKKYYHKGKLVKIVKKKKNKSSDSETISDESSDSDRKKKRKKYKKIVKVIKKRRRRTSDDSDSDSSSTEDSDSSRYRKKKRKSDKNNKKKRKESVKKGKKKKHYDSSESSDSEDEKERRKSKNDTSSKKQKVDASEE
ncbi:hypothetical protein O3M35_008266 [Rhynocoris fuscipes]|uniref:peptidylprolyl isomerase n=1 Tax=Rhynocoris fuscipes TaxID=488301 RepID=A0AAW1DBF9_9HEMI